MIKSEALQILDLSKKRYILLDKQEESYNEETDEYGIDHNEEIDEFANQILEKIKSHRHLLTFEFIIDELTKLGYAPSLLYDDDGRFAIAHDGYQTLQNNPDEKDELGNPKGLGDMSLTYFISPELWKDTIREALNYYLDTVEE